MMQLGVTTMADLRQDVTQARGRQPVSLLILDELARARCSDLRLYDRVIQDVRMSNGTFRETHCGRFSMLDPIIRDILCDRFPPEQALLISDCAVSNGATSVELYRMLRDAFPRLDYVATDLSFSAIVVKSRRWPWAVTFDASGAALQILVGPLVLPGQARPSIFHPVNRLARQLARASLVPRARAVLEQIHPADGHDFTARTIGGYDVLALPLVSSECLQLSRAQVGFRCEVHDLLRPARHRAHVVRAMNILIRAYFDDVRLRQAFRFALQAVLPNGLFISGRSPTSNPRDLLATILGRGADGFHVISRLNGGCEEEQLLLEVADMVAG